MGYWALMHGVLGINLLLSFPYQVIRLCHIGSATEPFFEEGDWRIVILVDLAVHGKLGVQATK